MQRSNQLLIATTAVASAVIVACGGGSEIPSGTLRLALTDAPACGFDNVFVTVDKVRVHKSGSANEGDDGWSEVVLSPPRRIDLLSLTNGALVELGQTPLTAGKYNQMRFVLAANSPSNPLANAVVPTGGVETPVTTPSGSQSGLKMNVDIEVEADKVADFALDFETCRSFVQLGQGSYLLKPVIAVIPRISDAVTRVTGQVAPALALPTTSVSLQLAGVPVRSTPPDSSGKFVLYPVPVGTYDLVVAAPGRAMAVVTGVPVSATASTTLPVSAPIDPPTSPMRSASGTVATGTTPIDAVVAADKSLVGGVQVTYARTPVNGTTGAFAFSLPSAAPVKTAYAAGATSLVFNADTAVPTGKYTLAGTTAATTKTIDIDVTTNDYIGGLWTLP
jgi:hypothetical protein